MTNMSIRSVAAALLLILLGVYAFINGYQLHNNFKNWISVIGMLVLAIGFAMLLQSAKEFTKKTKKRP